MKKIRKHLKFIVNTTIFLIYYYSHNDIFIYVQIYRTILKEKDNGFFCYDTLINNKYIIINVDI